MRKRNRVVGNIPHVEVGDYVFSETIVSVLSKNVERTSTKDTVSELMNWIKHAISYSPDSVTYGIDYIQSPSVTIRYGKGDCQDMVALTSSVLNYLNIPFRLVLGQIKPEEYHIWVEAKDGDVFYFLDPANDLIYDTKDIDVFYKKKYPDRLIKKKTEWL